MAKLYFGTDEINQGWDRYFDVCNAFEMRHPREQPPTLQTLNSWRVNSPRGFAFLMHANPDFVDRLEWLAERDKHSLDDRALTAWTATLERANAVAAKGIIIETPFEFTPSSRSRALMEDVAKLAADFKGVLIWESHGVWPVEETRDFAESIGLAYVIDPFQTESEGIEFSHGDAVFSITERSGLRRNFDDYDFSRMLRFTESYNRAFVLLRGQYKWRHARELNELLKMH